MEQLSPAPAPVQSTSVASSPSLSSLVAAGGVPQTTITSPPTPVNAETPTDTSLQQPGAAVSSPPSVPPTPDGGLAAQLRERGFDVPNDMSQQQVLDTIAAQIDEANQIRDANSANQTESGKLQTNVDPASALHNNTPAAPAPSQQPTPDLSQPVELSQDARILAQQGLVYQTDDGSWASKNPAFQSFADEHNRLGAWRQAVAMRFMDNPDSFISERLQTAQIPQSQDVQQLQEQVKALTDRLNAEQHATEKAQVSSWVDEHSQQLFINGDRKQLTPYAQRYNAIAKQIDGVSKQAGHQMSRSQLHQKTLQMLEGIGVTPEPVPPQQPQQQQQVIPQPQQQPPQQPQTFLQGAAQAAPRNTVNRLVEHPATQPNGVATTLSRNGFPSLAALVEQQKQL